MIKHRSCRVIDVGTDLEAVDAPAEHKWPDVIHHLDEVEQTGQHRGTERDHAGPPEIDPPTIHQ